MNNFNLESQKLQDNVSFSLQKGVILDPCLGKGCIFANTTLIKLLTNACAFPDRQILERVAFGKQQFCLTVALHRKKMKTPKHLNLILS